MNHQITDLIRIIEWAMVKEGHDERLRSFYQDQSDSWLETAGLEQVDSQLPEMAIALLTTLSFRILGVKDLPLTASLLMAYQEEQDGQMRSKPYLVN